MHRIDGAGATVDNKFTQGNPVTGVPATTVTDAWLNAVQEEVAALPVAAGVALDKAQNDQLLSVVRLHVENVAAMKLLPKPTKKVLVSTRGYYVAGDGGDGTYWHDAADIVSADNGVSVHVGTDGARWKLIHKGTVTVLQAGAKGDGATDDAPSIKNAIAVLSAAKIKIRVPARTYRLVPATAQTDEAGTNTAALLMASNMHIEAAPGSVFKIADGVSTDAAPLRHSMFFSNSVLSDISIVGLTMDMNGANNKISPSRPATYNRFTNAQIIFSGTPGGVAAGGNDVHIERCKFLNNAGVSCIVMAQSNTAGVALGKRWTVKDCLFYNVGTDTDDHSCVFGWAEDVEISGSTFENPAAYNNATKTGGLCAYEIHGSNTRFTGNRIKNFYQGLWVGSNLTEEAVRNSVICGNAATVSQTFVDFYSANLTSGASNEALIQHVEISGNVIEITADTVADEIKAFFKIAARKQPAMVRVADNVCRSYETTKNCVFALAVVSPDQLVEADQISISGNVAAGVVAGFVGYFGGTGAALNMGTVEFANNRLGVLLASPGGLLVNADVYLYGAANGKVNALRVSGLESPLPVKTDGNANGRATVFGKALLDLPVTWNNVTLGNATTSNKVAIDTDAGHADVSLSLTAGSTTSAVGAIYPLIAGLSANALGVLSGVVNYGASHAVLAGRIDVTGNYATIFSDGGQFSASVPGAFAAGTIVSIGGRFPCNSAAI